MATLILLKGMPDSAPLVALVNDPAHLIQTLRAMVEEDGLSEAREWDGSGVEAETRDLDDAGVVAWWCSGNAEDAERLRAYRGGELVLGSDGSVLSLVSVTVDTVTSVPWPVQLGRTA